MPSPGMKNDRVWSFALTWRPRGGADLSRHDPMLMRYLHDNAAQWEIYEETVDDDPATRHFHGRILLQQEHRMDKLKVKLCTRLGAVLDEKKVLQKGIKWLYDDWEDYISKDGLLWDREITDEDEWIYADPALKTGRLKNAEIKFWMDLIGPDLGPTTGAIEVRQLIMKQIVRDKLEMPTPYTLDQKVKRFVEYWNVLNEVGPDDVEISD